MKKLISHILVVLLLAVSIAAQVEENKPILFDEFEKMPLDETLARIENLAIGVNKIPNSKALIKIYGGQDISFTFAYNRGSLIKAIWTNNLKHPPEKLLIQFCDIDAQPLKTEFFLVRKNDTITACKENLTTPKESVLFDKVAFYSPEFKLSPLENIIVEHGFSEGEYSQFSMDVLKRLLGISLESKIYLIAYLKANSAADGNILAKKKGRPDKKSYAQKMFRAARRELINNGFSPSQIVTIDGGYVNGYERRLEFWFVPKGGAIPKPKPDYIPKKKRNK